MLERYSESHSCNHLHWQNCTWNHVGGWLPIAVCTAGERLYCWVEWKMMQFIWCPMMSHKNLTFLRLAIHWLNPSVHESPAKENLAYFCAKCSSQPAWLLGRGWVPYPTWLVIFLPQMEDDNPKIIFTIYFFLVVRVRPLISCIYNYPTFVFNKVGRTSQVKTGLVGGLV